MSSSGDGKFVRMAEPMDMDHVPSSSEEDEEIRNIGEELREIERGLEASPRTRQERSGVGQAAFNSVRSALGDIRSHLNAASLRHGDGPRERSLSQLTERLQTAEMAHSSRIPLGMLRGSDNLQRQRQSTRERLLSSLSRSNLALTSNKSEDNETEEGRGEAGNEGERAVPADRRTQYAGQRRRSSSLVASRLRANQVEGFQVDLDLHENGVGLLSPVEETASKEDSAMELSEEEGSTKLGQLERPMLLSKRQQMFVSSGSLSGSLQLPEVSSDSIVFSWGSGVQSLHDDAEDKLVEQALVGKQSRLARPGAPAVLSVATSRGHTACATSRGNVYTCGINSDGAVDSDRKDEEIIRRPTLLESIGETRVVQVSCGLDHTAALTSNGSVLTWGSNKEGQLGHRVSGQPSDTSTSYCRPRGMLLGGGRRAAAVACGHGFTLVLTSRMSLLACGVEEISGYHKNENHHVPSAIPAIEGLPLVGVAAGSRHAVVLTVHGSAFAWGDNTSGCCGRPYPASVTLPVPFNMPDSEYTAMNGPKPFANWAVWSGESVSLADDVAVVHAACGDKHTVLVTRSGRLLCCGSNEHGQLGLSAVELATNVAALAHPEGSAGRHFMTAEAGDGHTLLLDDAGDVWQMGYGRLTGPERVLAGKSVLTIAAGGDESIAVAAVSRAALRRQFSVTLESIALEGGLIAESMEDLLETIVEEDKQSAGGATVSIAGRELASRTEELLSCPAALNSLFLDPAELDQMHEKLISSGSISDQQAIATAVENGIRTGLEKLRPDHARLMYPETVRCLLLYVKFFDRNTEDTEIVFDRLGDCVSALCETILSLPFEGYKALLTWATSVYQGGRFVRMLVHPLLVQLDNGLRIDVDENGVQHNHLSRRAIPVIVAVLRWLHSASERVGDLTAPEDFYSVGVGNIPPEAIYEDLAKFKKASKAQRATNFFLCANPFLLSPGTKRNLLQVENQVEMIKVVTQDMTFNAEEGTYTIEPFYVLEIAREHLLHQTLAKLKKANPDELRKKLRVSFTGEEGVDAGGVTKEFFQLLSEALFDISSGMWSSRFGSDITWFNSDNTWDLENYELTGVLVGLALYNGVLLDVHFPMAVYRKLLGLPLGLEDLVDEELKKGLKQLLDYEGDDVEYIFCLTFEVTWSNLGQEQKIELKPGGSQIPVTSANREEYVLLYVKWLLVDSIEPQWDAFEKGMRRVMESASLGLFLPEELELLVVGTPELDFDALESNAEYEGGYTVDSDVIKNFWRFLKEASPESQLKFLKFATGSSQAPIGGLGELKFKIQRAGPDSHQLPTSHTCFNTLLLPDYGSDFDKLSRLLGRAILECEGFGLE